MSKTKLLSQKSQCNKSSNVPKLRFPEFLGAVKWKKKPLGDCLDYIQPTKYLVKSTAYNNSYQTPVLTAGKTFILGYTDETNGIFENNLPVIIFDDFTTATKFVDFPFKAKSSAMKILLTKNNINIKFVYETMQMIKYEIGTHERHWISKFTMLDINIPQPQEQQKIAACLTSLDELITTQTQKIDNLKTHKKGLMQQLFPVEGKTIPKLRFPEFQGMDKWESRKLGDIYETTSGGTPLKSKNEYYNTGVIPWLTSGEVAQGLIYKAKQTITELGLRKSSAKIFPKNTVLIAMYGATVGKIGLLKFKSSTNQAICGILPNDKFISEFLYQYLTIQTKMIAGLSGGGAQPNISQTIIKALEVPFPSLKEQKKIATCLSSLDELITLQIQKTANLKTHKKGLIQQLFPAIN